MVWGVGEDLNLNSTRNILREMGENVGRGCREMVRGCRGKEAQSHYTLH